jgi:hypothetical protein
MDCVLNGLWTCLENAQTIEQKFPTNAVKLTQAQAIRSSLQATLFPNPTYLGNVSLSGCSNW